MTHKLPAHKLPNKLDIFMQFRIFFPVFRLLLIKFIRVRYARIFLLFLSLRRSIFQVYTLQGLYKLYIHKLWISFAKAQPWKNPFWFDIILL